ncbi:MAG: hypothetical protein E7341_03565 [Clostridiales bacterium]|nr:hypothetical protein [Clostridiales bacterium]
MKDYSSIVVSSSIKLLRNLSGFDFPSTLSGTTGIKVLNKLADNILKIDNEFKIYKISSLSELDVNIMFEKGLISRHLIDSNEFGAVILSKDEEIAVMLNETDHIVETSTKKGLNLISAYDRLNVIDNEILSNLDIAYDDSFGFLTSNLNQVGTGLTATVSLFLPALTITGKLKSVLSGVSNQGFEIQTISDSAQRTGEYVCTISNSQTIGKREADYIVKLTELTIKISELEIQARKELLSVGYKDEVIDRVYRAWGVLTNCHKVSAQEAQRLLSDIKIGIAIDIMRFKGADFVENLITDVMPYSLTKISESKVAVADLDKYRAKFLANILKTRRLK